MIQLYNDPFLLDFLKVAARMPQDEREQLEAFTGQAYDLDGVAIGNFTVPGPKFVIKADGEPIAVGGFVPQRPGVFRDFMLTTPEAWEKHWFGVTRVCRHAMDWMLNSKTAHRLECICLASRETKNSRWYKTIGYNREATLYGFCASGADAVSFSRVKH